MRNMHAASIGIAGLLVGAAALLSPADARQIGGGVRVGGGHAAYRAPAGTAYRGSVNRTRSVSRSINRDISRNVAINRNVNVNRAINRNVNVNRKYVYRNGRRGYWRNGVWIALPLAGATYGYTGGSCSYMYNQWQKTNSVYWRDRYYSCANASD
jgi:hypothetical protein